MNLTIRSDFPQLENKLRDLGKVPKTAVSQGALAGARVVRNTARHTAPVKSGAFRKSIKTQRQRTRKARAAYSVGPDTDNGVRISKKGARYFYPASLEYGYMKRGKAATYAGKIRKDSTGVIRYYYSASDRDRADLGGDRVPGEHYMRRAAHESEPAATEAMSGKFATAVEKVWTKKEANKLHDGF